MANLLIKNRYAVSLKKLLKETQDEGGIPDKITVSGREAWDILNEIRSVGQGGTVGFVVESTDLYDPQFYLKRSTEKLQQEVAQDVVNRWLRNEFLVFFKKDGTKVPVIVIPDKKKQSKIEVKVTPVPDKESSVVRIDSKKKVDKPEETDNNKDID